ncbi:DNA polymerase delta, subunit 4-domain-containing protein [Filobasidium floriforme]|uniref:DNA polymerase delta, subunit 4-domain-containing protein n=1 Tax=Filobasidium floriforme TaxID=5210 RepID=UPI001E8D1C22|nr:DNA polymerase delta, subunit 4-domain-containing protein [Filobasidium floriforme]KAH8081416.1 DNA polymerase delta, subunit 4-domain-containing protein [Filobasidium floriforme]
MSSKTRPRTTQSALGFSAKKSIHKSPTKKKAPVRIAQAQAIDLTRSSPPQNPKHAPLFTRPNRSATAFSDTNPFLEDDGAEKDEKPQPAVERDEFGFVRTVPLDYSPLGKGKPTQAMIANLVGEKAKEDEERKEEKGEVDESDEGGDRAFFLIEKRRGDVKSARIEEGGKLNVKDKRWNELFKETKEKMGNAEPIHCDSKSHNRVHHILRVFDLSSQWGPCVGISRLDRWNRAEEWGLEPPVEVRDILLTQEGQKDDSYKETVFHNTGIYVP